MNKNIKIAVVSIVTWLFLHTSPVLAAQAIVKSDPVLNFDSVKLEQTLTDISNKSGLNPTFYSLNSESDERAVTINDRFVSDINRSNYITLVYNRDINNKAKGTFSVNVGGSFRDVVDKDYIKENIVDPNIRKYLPADPQGFIPTVATAIVDAVNSRREFNNNTASFMQGLFLLFLVIGICIGVTSFISVLMKVFKEQQQKLKELRELSNTLNIEYSKVLENSKMLTGYTGVTEELANSINTDLANLQEFYRKLPYTDKLSLFDTNKVNDFISKMNLVSKQVNDFLTQVELAKTNIRSYPLEGFDLLDPVAYNNKLKEINDAKQEITNLKGKAKTLMYQHAINSDSPLYELLLLLNNSSSLDLVRNNFKRFKDAYDIEVKVIERFKDTKQKVLDLCHYILVSKKITYYMVPFTSDQIAKADRIKTETNAISNYNKDLDKLIDVLAELEILVSSYKEQDRLHDSIATTKISLLNKIANRPAAFNKQAVELTKKINSINYINAANYKLQRNSLQLLEVKVNELVSAIKDYEARRAQLRTYSTSSPRRQKLSVALDNYDYNSFDSLVNAYHKQDTEAAKATSSSYNSSSSTSDWGSSSSDSSFGSSSSSDSGW